MIKEDAVIRFSKNPELGKGVDDERNEQTKQHQFFLGILPQNTASRKNHLEDDDGNPNKSQIHEHLHKGVVGHFAGISVRTLEIFFIIDAHEAKTEQRLAREAFVDEGLPKRKAAC